MDYALFTNKYYSFTIVLPANTIPAVLARALPLRVAPVSKVIDCMDIIVPLKAEVVPKVAELPTCQNIWDAEALPLRKTLRPDVTVNDDAT